MPRVSVVIPAYNRAAWLFEAIDSALAQTYRDIEIIVVDHGSTDGTGDAARARYGSRIRVITTPNCPLPACSRNTGIEQATGEFVAFLDSDDRWLPGKLAAQIPPMEADPSIGWSYGNARRFGEGVATASPETGAWNLRSGRVFEALMMGNFVPSCTVVVRRTALADVGPFDKTPELRAVEDFELWLRLAHKYPVSVVPEVVAEYRVSPAQISSSMEGFFAPERHALETARRKLGVDAALFDRALGAYYLRHFRYAVMSGAAKAAAEERLASARRLSHDPRARVYAALWPIGGAAAVRGCIGLERFLKRILTSH